MKKIVIALLAAVTMTAAASALDLSAGAVFDYTFAHRFGKGSLGPIDYDAKLNTSMLGFKGFLTHNMRLYKSDLTALSEKRNPK